MRFLILLFLLPLNSVAFLSPDELTCKTMDRVQIVGPSAKKMYAAGIHNFKISEVSALNVFNKKSLIAKLYPQAGIESVLLSKKFRIDTDQRNYWNVVKLPNRSLISCEIVNE